MQCMDYAESAWFNQSMGSPYGWQHIGATTALADGYDQTANSQPWGPDMVWRDVQEVLGTQNAQILSLIRTTTQLSYAQKELENQFQQLRGVLASGVAFYPQRSRPSDGGSCNVQACASLGKMDGPDFSLFPPGGGELAARPVPMRGSRGFSEQGWLPGSTSKAPAPGVWLTPLANSRASNPPSAPPSIVLETIVTEAVPTEAAPHPGKEAPKVDGSEPDLLNYLLQQQMDQLQMQPPSRQAGWGGKQEPMEIGEHGEKIFDVRVGKSGDRGGVVQLLCPGMHPSVDVDKRSAAPIQMDANQQKKAKAKAEPRPPGPTACPAMAVPQGKAERPDAGFILVIGGLNESGQAIGTAESFSVSGKAWQPLPPMKKGRCCVGQAVVDGNFLTIGGVKDIRPNPEKAKGETLPLIMQGEPFDKVEAFSLRRHSWEAQPSLQVARNAPAIFTVGKTVYAFGGAAQPGKPAHASAECWTFGDPAWRQLPPMRHPRYMPATAELNGNFYFCGGTGTYWAGEETNTAECFCPSQEVWEELPNMCSERFLAGAATLGGQLYICGGVNEAQYVAERFDPSRRSWERLPRLKRGRAGACVVSLALKGRSCILVCGGHECLPDEPQKPIVHATCECFVPGSPVWETVSTMPFCRSLSSCVSDGEHLYVFGGMDGGRTVSTAARMFPATGLWQGLTSMKTTRVLAAAAFLKA